jgi:uncharacterized protein (DUF608 family)
LLVYKLLYIDEMKRELIVFSCCLLFIGISHATAQEWPVLKHYDEGYTYKIALPVGGIGTGTVSLGGRGNLQDWEIMNTPAKGYNPGSGRNNSPFFALYTEVDGKKDTRLLEGPVPFYLYEGDAGAIVTNHGLPRFGENTFDATYPFGQVNLRTPQIPVDVKIKAFNPLIPADIDNSSIPIAVIDFVLTNTSDEELTFSICGSMQNFIGEDGSEGKAKDNRNNFREEEGIQGVYFSTAGVDSAREQWGNMALVTESKGDISYRTEWLPIHWGSSILDFWDDFSEDGVLDYRKDHSEEASGVSRDEGTTPPLTYKPMASLAVRDRIPPRGTKTVRYLLTWYFPNRNAWSAEPLRNYYTTRYEDAWDVVMKTVPGLPDLEKRTIEFVDKLCNTDLPEDVLEAALFNISTLRTQTCFRLDDGNFFTWEGCRDNSGCCFGSCTHVWNYESATAFLFGDLAQTMRNVEFGLATTDLGLMNYRVRLPYDRIPEYAGAAADGQMGCLLKLYREWQLSGDDDFLKALYPQAKKALSYAWIKGGWDANQDGVMEGVQHNTMDVEYYGPNPQMTIWYLGALRAMEEMSAYMKDREMAKKCRKLFNNGSKWTDENLFNGEYYIQKIEVPPIEEVPKEHIRGMGSRDYGNPDYQLGEACLVDQLVGQYLAHVCGLGYLVKEENVTTTLQSIMKYNYRSDLSNHFNCMRTYALADESSLLMAAYPRSRPVNPFPYFTEAMTGFEYSAAVGMLQEGQIENGLKCISSIRDRYDGRKRSPFNEAECGHHYGRAMASWSALLALTDFHYSGVEKKMTFTSNPGTYFWSNGYAWGTCKVEKGKATLDVVYGELHISEFSLQGEGSAKLKTGVIKAGESRTIQVKM